MKRVLLLIMALTLSVVAHAQVFRMQMDVLEGPDNQCYTDIMVSWGVKGDTIAFRYNQKLLVMERIVPNEHQMEQLSAIHRGNIGDFVLVRKDSRLFLIRMIQSSRGLVIFINNLEDRREYYLFDFTELELCNANLKKS